MSAMLDFYPITQVNCLSECGEQAILSWCELKFAKNVGIVCVCNIWGHFAESAILLLKTAGK